MQISNTEASPRQVSQLPSLFDKVKQGNVKKVSEVVVEGKSNTIDLSGKKLVELGPQLIEHFPSNLLHLSLRQNLISRFPMNLMLFPKIQILDLSENKLQVLPKEILSLQFLKELYLNNNLLKKIPPLTLMSNMRVLSLSYNWITEIPAELPWNSLRCFYIDKNVFKQLPIEFGKLGQCLNIRLDWFKYVMSRYAKPELPLHFEVKQNQEAFDNLLEKLRAMEKQGHKHIQLRDFIEKISTQPVNFLGKDQKGKNLLFQAASDEHLGVICDLAVYHPPLTDQLDNELHSPLSLALLEQRMRSATVLLDCGANPNQKNGPFGTCLHLAIFKRSIDMVQKLLNAGADPNLVDQDGNTPLHFVFSSWSKGDTLISQHLSEMLLQNGSNPNLKNKDGWCPVHIAVKKLQLGALLYAIKFNGGRYKNKSQFQTVRRRSSSLTPSSRVKKLQYEFKFNKRGGPNKLSLAALATSSGVVEMVSLVFQNSLLERDNPSHVDLLIESLQGKNIIQLCFPALVLKKWTRKMFKLALEKKLQSVIRSCHSKQTYQSPSNTIKQPLRNFFLQVEGDQQVEDLASSYHGDDDTYKIPRAEEGSSLSRLNMNLRLGISTKSVYATSKIGSEFSALSDEILSGEQSLSIKLMRLAQLQFVESKLQDNNVSFIIGSHLIFMEILLFLTRKMEKMSILEINQNFTKVSSQVLNNICLSQALQIRAYQEQLHPKLPSQSLDEYFKQITSDAIVEDQYLQFRQNINDKQFDDLMCLIRLLRFKKLCSQIRTLKANFSHSTRTTILQYELFQSGDPQKHQKRHSRMKSTAAIPSRQRGKEDIAEEQKINLSHSTQVLISPFKKKR